jgi:hypothetical protein
MAETLVMEAMPTMEQAVEAEVVLLPILVIVEVMADRAWFSSNTNFNNGPLPLIS